MNKAKVRCTVCGKSFKTPSLKKTICPNCEADAKRARHLPAAAPAPRAAAPSQSVDVRAVLRAAQDNQGQFGAYRAPAPPPPAEPPSVAVRTGPQAYPHRPTGAATPAARAERPPRAERKPRPARPDTQRVQRPIRERKPRQQIAPFVPTQEHIDAIRARYIELAQPEFDGIRHQIATELGIPLRAVKQVIKQVRSEEQLPSWWERAGSMPSAEQIEEIRAVYVPMLPNPTIGVHKEIAASLRLSNTSVYQAIGQIRAELELPRYAQRAEAAEDGAPASHAHEGTALAQAASAE